MQEALPYKTWLPNDPAMAIKGGVIKLKGRQTIKNIVSENAVIIFGRRGCCMSHVIRLLFLGHGVNPAIYEVEEDENEAIEELEAIRPIDLKEGPSQLPAVFIGGRLFGGLDRVMATHISGELVPILKQAGALWL